MPRRTGLWTRNLRPLAAIAIATATCLQARAAGAQMIHLSSPNGRITAQVSASPEATTWSGALDGKPVLDPAPLGLALAGQGDLLAGAKLVGHKTSLHSEAVKVLFGRSSSADNSYSEAVLRFRSKSNAQFRVVFRCFDDAIAFRYEIPKQPGLAQAVVAEESTEFRPTGSPISHVQYLENYRTPHENQVATALLHQVKPDALLDLPAVFEQNGITTAITEASLRKYAGMALMRQGKGLVSKLTPREDGNKVVTDLPMMSPWRVALISDHLGALLESSTLYCLNEPSAIKDTSWIKPGKLTFHWWNGDIFDPARPMKILSLECQKKYIDFAHDNGIPFHAISSDEDTNPWYYQETPGVAPSPSSDVTRLRPGFNLPAVRAYAKQKGVRLWTWVHQGALKGRVEEAFAAFENMGWEGIMVDFFDHDDQASVELSEEVLAAAARHHILVHLHGVWKPTGLQRTFPNLMNHEAALNLEYLKWSADCTPEHTLKLAFTRFIAGPTDYHLGGFRAVKREDFKPIFRGPNVLGTRAAMLAMYVCLDNPSPMVADYPAAYIGQPGFDFLRLVPTWWDETRVLKTVFGRLLVTARRKGDEWYIGGLSAGKPQEVHIPLSWLGDGTWKASIWSDTAQTEDDPNEIQVRTQTIKNSDTLTVKAATDGGFAVRFTKG